MQLHRDGVGLVVSSEVGLSEMGLLVCSMGLDVGALVLGLKVGASSVLSLL